MNKNNHFWIALGVCICLMICGCGKNVNDAIESSEVTSEVSSSDATPENNINDNTITEEVEASNETDIEQNVAQDTDRRELLKSLISKNEDAIAWLVVPGTDIDYPVLQSWEDDNYYASHNESGEIDNNGALYIEMANMSNMCDFNTVIHGSSGENGLFKDLISFEDPDFFEENEEFVLYLEDNKLTYEIWAVFERDNNSLIREYDFSYMSGCKEFLDDVYGDKVMGKHIRGGWGDANEYMFMVTLTLDNPSSDKQLVVLGALIDDEQGTIDRVVYE